MDNDDLLQTQPGTPGEEMFLNRMYELQLTILVFIPIVSIFILLYCARLVVEAKSEPQPRTYDYEGDTMATQDDRNDNGLELEFDLQEDIEEQRRQPQQEEFQGQRRRRRRGRNDGPTTPIIQQVPDEISVALGGGEDPEIEASEIEVDVEIDSGTDNVAPIQIETNEDVEANCDDGAAVE